MKILTFFTGLSYAGEANSYIRGAEARFIETVKRFGEETHVIASIDDCTLLKNLDVSAVYHPFKHTDTKIPLLNIILRTIKAYQTFHNLKNHFDLVYLYSPLLSNLIPSYFAKRKLNIPLIAVIHVLPFTSFSLRNIFQSYRKLQFSRFDSLISMLADQSRFALLRRVSFFIAINSEIKDSLVNCGFDSRKIGINGNAIDFNLLNSVPNQRKLYDICYLSAINTYKGVFDLIEICINIIRSGKKDLKVIIIGSGNKKEVVKLQDMIKINRLGNNIEFLGPTPSDVAFKIIKQSRLFVLPTRYETWCIAICEAMALGTPVITYDLPVFREIYPEGILSAPVGDLEELKEIVIKILNDVNRYQKLAEKGKELSKKYSWGEVTTKELNLIKNFLSTSTINRDSDIKNQRF